MALKVEFSSRRLWKAVMLSFVVYGLGLGLYFTAGFISVNVAKVLFFIANLVWLLTLNKAVEGAISHQAVLLTAAGVVCSCGTVYAYLYFFLR